MAPRDSNSRNTIEKYRETLEDNTIRGETIADITREFGRAVRGALDDAVSADRNELLWLADAVLLIIRPDGTLRAEFVIAMAHAACTWAVFDDAPSYANLWRASERFYAEISRG